jgi:hypothetical protein
MKTGIKPASVFTCAHPSQSNGSVMRTEMIHGNTRPNKHQSWFWKGSEQAGGVVSGEARAIDKSL